MYSIDMLLVDVRKPGLRNGHSWSIRFKQIRRCLSNGYQTLSRRAMPGISSSTSL